MKIAMQALLAATLLLGTYTAAQTSSDRNTNSPAASSTPEAPKERTTEAAYIPKNLEDCFVQLEKLLKPADIERMRRGTEEDMIQYHLSLGMWIRNNWGLWRGSRLAKWFNERGLRHPDDMSGVILDSFWRHLNGKPLNVDHQIREHQEFWKRQKAVQPDHSSK